MRTDRSSSRSVLLRAGAHLPMSWLWITCFPQAQVLLMLLLCVQILYHPVLPEPVVLWIMHS
jgi:hypothetical protein